MRSNEHISSVSCYFLGSHHKDLLTLRSSCMSTQKTKLRKKNKQVFSSREIGKKYAQSFKSVYLCSSCKWCKCETRRWENKHTNVILFSIVTYVNEEKWKTLWRREKKISSNKWSWLKMCNFYWFFMCVRMQSKSINCSK